MIRPKHLVTWTDFYKWFISLIVVLTGLSKPSRPSRSKIGSEVSTAEVRLEYMDKIGLLNNSSVFCSLYNIPL